MASQTKQKFFGAILLLAILVICIPLWISSKHASLALIPNDPPKRPEMPVINLTIPPIPQNTMSPAPAQMTALTQTSVPTVLKSSTQAQSLQNSWRLKLGNFSHEKNCLSLIETLKKDDFEAYSETITEPNGKVVYQVFIGPAVTELEAVQLQKHLWHHLGMQSMIVAYPTESTKGEPK